MPQTRRQSRDAALVELQRLHAAILASRERRGLGAAPVADAAAPSAETLAAQELTRRLQADTTPTTDAQAAPAGSSRRVWWIPIAAAVVLAGAWAAYTLSPRSEVVTEAAPPRTAPPAEPEPPVSAPGVAAPSASPAAPIAASPALGSDAPVTPAGSGRAVHVALELVRPVWLSVSADGTRVHRGTADAGQRLTFDADRAVIVRAGDAGGVRLTVNGVDRGALGLRGWPLTVAITRGGVEPLTPTRPEP